MKLDRRTVLALAAAAPLAQATHAPPRWNFHKYLVDRQASAVLAFPSEVAPEDRRITAQIERLLG